MIEFYSGKREMAVEIESVPGFIFIDLNNTSSELISDIQLSFLPVLIGDSGIYNFELLTVYTPCSLAPYAKRRLFFAYKASRSLRIDIVIMFRTGDEPRDLLVVSKSVDITDGNPRESANALRKYAHKGTIGPPRGLPVREWISSIAALTGGSFEIIETMREKGETVERWLCTNPVMLLEKESMEHEMFVFAELDVQKDILDMFADILHPGNSVEVLHFKLGVMITRLKDFFDMGWKISEIKMLLASIFGILGRLEIPTAPISSIQATISNSTTDGIVSTDGLDKGVLSRINDEIARLEMMISPNLVIDL